MTKYKIKPAGNKIDSSVQNIKEKPFRKLNIAFSLMTIIPFLVFLYLLTTRLFSVSIMIGDVGLAVAVAFLLSALGYWVGYSIVQNLLSKILNYTEQLKSANAQLGEAQELLIQAEKFKAIGQLASGIAHEVKNPLGIILQDINYLEENKPTDEEFLRLMSMMKKHINRADDIITALVDFSRTSKIDIKPLDLNSLLDNSLLLIKHRTESKKVKFVKEYANDLPKILADNVKMEQVFVNIFLNAVQAMPDGGTLTIRTYLKKFETMGLRTGRGNASDLFNPGETVALADIEDTGVGISKESLGRIFDPFFTTKGPREGTGLGLSVSRNIVEQHGGLIGIESKEGHGTKVTIVLQTLGGQNGRERSQ